MFRRDTKRPRFSLGGQPIIDHDDSSNHSGFGMPEYEEDSLSRQHQATTASNFDSSFTYGQFAPDRPRRAPKSNTKSHQDDNTNLNACLDHLLRILSRKDKEGFFQYPVTDQVSRCLSFFIGVSLKKSFDLVRTWLFDDNCPSNGFFNDEKEN